MATPFTWTQLQLADEERRLRLSAQHDDVVYGQLLEELAQMWAPQQVEAHKRCDPAYFLQLDATGWRHFFRSIQSNLNGTDTWSGSNNATPIIADLRRQNEELRQRNRCLLAELEVIRGTVETRTVDDRRLTIDDGKATMDGGRRTIAKNTDRPHFTVHRPSSIVRDPPIALPDHPPTPYQHLFHNWTREGLTLGLLANTGWSLRHTIGTELAQYLGITANAGSLKRLFDHLKRAGLWQMETVEVGQGRVTLVKLTELGKQVMDAIEVPAVESEWERLDREHGGDRQIQHTALVCLFTHQARLRGYNTEVCPQTNSPTQPDVRIFTDSESLYVEVEAESGDAQRRMKKWRNQCDLQGLVALCAPTPEVRTRLVAEARIASHHGKATDLDSLFKQEKLWCVEW